MNNVEKAKSSDQSPNEREIAQSKRVEDPGYNCDEENQTRENKPNSVINPEWGSETDEFR